MCTAISTPLTAYHPASLGYANRKAAHQLALRVLIGCCSETGRVNGTLVVHGTNAIGGRIFSMREGIRHDGSALRASETDGSQSL